MNVVGVVERRLDVYLERSLIEALILEFVALSRCLMGYSESEGRKVYRTFDLDYQVEEVFVRPWSQKVLK
jgi:hypothetical protein